MLARCIRIGRQFATKAVTENRPPYMSDKSQVNLDKYVRDYRDHPERLHPAARKRYNKYSQAVEPLRYKLHPEPERLDFLTPLGVKEEIPWAVVRTKSYNLPVYRRYTRGRSVNFTEIRLIDGDIQV